MSGRREGRDHDEEEAPLSRAGARSERSSNSRSAEGSFVTAFTAEPTDVSNDYCDGARRDSKPGKEYAEARNTAHRSDRHPTSESTRRTWTDEEPSSVTRRNSGRSRGDSRKSSKSDKESVRERGSNIASLPENQFPGEFPATYSKPYRPPGLAAEYYGDLGESVVFQPGVRPNQPSIVTSAEQAHLIEPTVEPRPPPEPSSVGQVGAAASYFETVPSDLDTGAQSTPSRPPQNSASRPSKPNKHDSHDASPRTSPRPGGHQFRPQIYGPVATGAPSASAMPTVAGAAAEYFSVSDQATMADTTYHTPTRPPAASFSATTPLSAPAGFGASSEVHSDAAWYGGAALAGTVAGAYIAAHDHNEHWHSQHRPPLRPSGTVNRPPAYHGTPLQQAHRHKRSGPLGKLVDWFRDPDAVAQYEQYTEAIGVCKYCFDPWTSPADAPRKHHYRRRRPSSGSRYGSATRVDKTARYSSDEDRRRRSGAKKVVVGGLAGYGAAKLGHAILKTNHDFDDMYSVKSGQPIDQSQLDVHDRDVGHSRRARRHSSSEDLRNQRNERRRTKGKHQDRVGHRKSRRRDSSSSVSSSSSSHGRSHEVAIKAGIGAAGLAVGAVALDKKMRGDRKGKSRSPPPRKKYFSKRVSPMHSYVDLSTPTNGRNGLVGFFASPSANKQKGKKPKGFFNFANSSSSSSDADLAFGEGTVRRKVSNRQRKQGQTGHARRDSTKSMTQLVAEGYALASESDRRKGKGRERYTAHGVIGRGDKRSSLHKLSAPEDDSDAGQEDGWYDVNDGDDQSSSSVDTSLAYGEDPLEVSLWEPRRPPARSQDLGYDRRSSGSTRHGHDHVLPPGMSKNTDPRRASASGVMSAAAAAAGTAAAMGVATDSQAFPQTGSKLHDNLPPLQHLEPQPISDSREDLTATLFSEHDGAHQSARVSAASVPLRQPQPVSPVAPIIYDENFVSKRQDKGSSNLRMYDPTRPTLQSQTGETDLGRGSGRGTSWSTRRRRDSSPADLSSPNSRDLPHTESIYEQPSNGSRADGISRNKQTRPHEDSRRKSADAALMAVAGATAAAMGLYTSVSDTKSSRSASPNTTGAADERVAEIERELERLYEEQRLMQDGHNKQKSKRSSKGVDFAEPLLVGKDEGRGPAQATTNLRKSSMKKTKRQEPSPPPESQQERIARMAAQRVKSTPSPVHEDYGTFFVPKEIREHLKEHNDKAEHRDDMEANVVEIVPGATRSMRQHPFDPFTYRPFGLELDDDPTLHPWPVPMLELVEPTPPGSQTHSVQGDISPIITAKSIEEAVDLERTVEKGHSTEHKPTSGDSDGILDDARIPETEPSSSTPLPQPRTNDSDGRPTPDLPDEDGFEAEAAEEDQARPGIGRVWTLEESEADKLERVLPVVDDTPLISRVWTIDDREAEQIERETSNGVSHNHDPAEAEPQIIEARPKSPQPSSSYSASGKFEDVFQTPLEGPQPSNTVYQSPFAETVTDLGVTGDHQDHAQTSVAALDDRTIPEEPGEPVSPRRRSLAREMEPASSLSRKHIHSSAKLVDSEDSVSPSVFPGMGAAAVLAAESLTKTSSRYDTISPAEHNDDIDESTKPEPSSAFDGLSDAYSGAPVEADYRSDPEDWEHSPGLKRSKKSRRAARGEVGSETNGSHRVTGQPTQTEEYPNTLRRSNTDDDLRQRSTNSVDSDRTKKDKKSSGFLGNIFPSSKSDISTPSKKSSKSLRSEDLADRGLDGPKERRKKRRSKGKDSDDVGSVVSEPAGRTRRLSDPANGASKEKMMSRDHSVDDAFVSAESSPERSIPNVDDGEPFLENRPEMPPPTAPVPETGSSGVSGPASMADSSFQHAKGQHISVNPQVNVLEPMPKPEAQRTGDDVETFNEASPFLPSSVSSQRLSAIRTSDDPSSPTTTSSPTAVPLHFRRPPLSPTNARFSMSPPIASPNSPLTTPRTRQGRPKSTEFRASKEFRPLYLVERRNYARTAANPETEEYPSLPSSKTSSAHPSMEDLRAEAQAQEQLGCFSPTHITPEMFRGRRHSFSHWHDGETRRDSPDYLDSRSATPVPGEHQRAREMEKKQKPKYEFHSPSELLQDPSSLDDVPPVDEDTGLGSPLPSVHCTEGEQDYMSARSRSLSSTRSRSLSRGRKAASRSRSTSTSWKDTLSSTVTAAIGAVAGVAVSAVGKKRTEDDKTSRVQDSTDAQSGHGELKADDTGKEMKEASLPDGVDDIQRPQSDVEFSHEAACSSIGPESAAPAQPKATAEEIKVQGPDSGSNPPSETPLESLTTVQTAGDSSISHMAAAHALTKSEVGNAFSTRSMEPSVPGPTKDGLPSEADASLAGQHSPVRDDAVETSFEDPVPSFVVKSKKSKKDKKKKKRNTLTFDEELPSTPQDHLEPESNNAEFAKKESAAPSIPTSVLMTVERSAFTEDGSERDPSSLAKESDSIGHDKGADIDTLVDPFTPELIRSEPIVSDLSSVEPASTTGPLSTQTESTHQAPSYEPASSSTLERGDPEVVHSGRFVDVAPFVAPSNESHMSEALNEPNLGKHTVQSDEASVPGNITITQAVLDPLEEAFEAAVQARGLREGASLGAAYQAFQPEGSDQFDIAGTPLTTIEEESDAPLPALGEGVVMTEQLPALPRKLSKKERRKEKKLSKNSTSVDDFQGQDPAGSALGPTATDKNEHPQIDDVPRRPFSDVEASKDMVLNFVEPPNPFGDDFEIRHTEPDDSTPIIQSKPGDPVLAEAELAGTPPTRAEEQGPDDEWPTGSTTSKKAKKAKKDKKNKKRQSLTWEDSEPAAQADTLPVTEEGSAFPSARSAASETASDMLSETESSRTEIPHSREPAATQSFTEPSEELGEMSSRKSKKSKKKSLIWTDKSASLLPQPEPPATTSTEADLVNDSRMQSDEDSFSNQAPAPADQIADEAPNSEHPAQSVQEHETRLAPENLDLSQLQDVSFYDPEVVETAAIADTFANAEELESSHQDTVHVAGDFVITKTSKKKSKRDKKKRVSGDNEATSSASAIPGPDILALGSHQSITTQPVPDVRDRAKDETVGPTDLRSLEALMTHINEQDRAGAVVSESDQSKIAEDWKTGEQDAPAPADIPTPTETEELLATNTTSSALRPEDSTEITAPTEESAPAEPSTTLGISAPEPHDNVEHSIEQQTPAEDESFFPMPTKKTKKDKKKKRAFIPDDVEASSGPADNASVAEPEGFVPTASSEYSEPREAHSSENTAGSNPEVGSAGDLEKVPDEDEGFSFSISSKKSKKDKKRNRRNLLAQIEDNGESISSQRIELSSITEDPGSNRDRDALPEKLTEEGGAFSTTQDEIFNTLSENIALPAMTAPNAIPAQFQTSQNEDLIPCSVGVEEAPITPPSSGPTDTHRDQKNFVSVDLAVKSSASPPPTIAFPGSEEHGDGPVVERAVGEHVVAEPATSKGVPSESRALTVEPQALESSTGDPPGADAETIQSPRNPSPTADPSTAETIANDRAVQEGGPAMIEDTDKVLDEDWGFPTKKSKKDKKKKRQSKLEDIQAPGPSLAGFEPESKTVSLGNDAVEPSLDQDFAPAIDVQAPDIGEEDWAPAPKMSKKDKKKKRRSELQTIVGQSVEQPGLTEQSISQNTVSTKDEETPVPVRDSMGIAAPEVGDRSAQEALAPVTAVETIGATGSTKEPQRHPSVAATQEGPENSRGMASGMSEGQEQEPVSALDASGSFTEGTSQPQYADDVQEIEMQQPDELGGGALAEVTEISDNHILPRDVPLPESPAQLSETNVTPQDMPLPGSPAEISEPNIGPQDVPSPESPALEPGPPLEHSPAQEKVVRSLATHSDLEVPRGEATEGTEDPDTSASLLTPVPAPPESIVYEDPDVSGDVRLIPDDVDNQDWSFTTMKAKKGKKKKRQPTFDDSVFESPAATGPVEEETGTVQAQFTSIQATDLVESPAAPSDPTPEIQQAPAEPIVEEEWAVPKRSKKEKKKKKRQSTIDEATAGNDVKLSSGEPQPDSRVQWQATDVVDNDPNRSMADFVPSSARPETIIIVEDVESGNRSEVGSRRDPVQDDTASTEQDHQAAEQSLPDLDFATENSHTTDLLKLDQPAEIQHALDSTGAGDEVTTDVPVPEMDVETTRSTAGRTQPDDPTSASGIVRALTIQGERSGDDEIPAKAVENTPAVSNVDQAEDILQQSEPSLEVGGPARSDESRSAAEPHEKQSGFLDSSFEDKSDEKHRRPDAASSEPTLAAPEVPDTRIPTSKFELADTLRDEKDVQSEPKPPSAEPVTAEVGVAPSKKSKRDKKKKRAAIDQATSEQQPPNLPRTAIPPEELATEAGVSLTAPETPIPDVEPHDLATALLPASAPVVTSETQIEDKSSQPIGSGDMITIAQDAVMATVADGTFPESRGGSPPTSAEHEAAVVPTADDSASPTAENALPAGESHQADLPAGRSASEPSEAIVATVEALDAKDQIDGAVPPEPETDAFRTAPPEGLPEDEWSYPSKKSKKKSKKNKFLPAQEVESHDVPAYGWGQQEHQSEATAAPLEATADQDLTNTPPAADIEGYFTPIGKKKSKKDEKTLSALASAAVGGRELEEASKETGPPMESEVAIAQPSLTQNESQRSTLREEPQQATLSRDMVSIPTEMYPEKTVIATTGEVEVTTTAAPTKTIAASEQEHDPGFSKQVPNQFPNEYVEKDTTGGQTGLEDVPDATIPQEEAENRVALADEKYPDPGGQPHGNTPGETMINDPQIIEQAPTEAQPPQRKSSKKERKAKNARRLFEFDGSEGLPPPTVSSAPEVTKVDVPERRVLDGDRSESAAQPTQEVDDMSDVSASTRERRKRRRSPPVWSGEEPEDLPNQRPLTPAHDQDIMSTALGIAAGLGFGADENNASKAIPQKPPSPARQQSAGWSFAKLGPIGDTARLDANRDSGVQFESPVMPMDQFPPTRDSGFIPGPADHHPADAVLRDVERTMDETVRPPRPQSPTSSTEDVSTTSTSRALHDDNATLETPRRKPSPVESTSKDRSSVLFANSPALPTPSPMKSGSRSPEPPSTPLRRSPSIHGRQQSHEELRQRGSTSREFGSGDELASNLIDSAAKAEVNRSTIEPTGDGFDMALSPPRNTLNTIREDPVEASLSTSGPPALTSPPPSLGSPVPHSQHGMREAGLIAAAAGTAGLAAAALPASPRDSLGAKSLGRSKSRTSSLRNLRGASVSPFDPASFASRASQAQAFVDERGPGEAATRERDMADVYVSSPPPT